MAGMLHQRRGIRLRSGLAGRRRRGRPPAHLIGVRAGHSRPAQPDAVVGQIKRGQVPHLPLRAAADAVGAGEIYGPLEPGLAARTRSEPFQIRERLRAVRRRRARVGGHVSVGAAVQIRRMHREMHRPQIALTHMDADRDRAAVGHADPLARRRRRIPRIRDRRLMRRTQTPEPVLAVATIGVGGAQIAGARRDREIHLRRSVRDRRRIIRQPHPKRMHLPRRQRHVQRSLETAVGRSSPRRAAIDGHLEVLLPAVVINNTDRQPHITKREPRRLPALTAHTHPMHQIRQMVVRVGIVAGPDRHRLPRILFVLSDEHRPKRTTTRQIMGPGVALRQRQQPRMVVRDDRLADSALALDRTPRAATNEPVPVLAPHTHHITRISLTRTRQLHRRLRKIATLRNPQTKLIRHIRTTLKQRHHRQSITLRSRHPTRITARRTRHPRRTRPELHPRPQPAVIHIHPKPRRTAPHRTTSHIRVPHTHLRREIRVRTQTHRQPLRTRLHHTIRRQRQIDRCRVRPRTLKHHKRIRRHRQIQRHTRVHRPRRQLHTEIIHRIRRTRHNQRHRNALTSRQRTRQPHPKRHRPPLQTLHNRRTHTQQIHRHRHRHQPHPKHRRHPIQRQRQRARRRLGNHRISAREEGRARNDGRSTPQKAGRVLRPVGIRAREHRLAVIESAGSAQLGTRSRRRLARPGTVPHINAAVRDPAAAQPVHRRALMLIIARVHPEVIAGVHRRRRPQRLEQRRIPPDRRMRPARQRARSRRLHKTVVIRDVRRRRVTGVRCDEHQPELITGVQTGRDQIPVMRHHIDPI